eukprot:TRINITY_DN3105_c0_g1_i1.p1 TRINITY_DN3105_c0_g1~~TRINITY_DN3105_c0_g1_i1.p1  ORF type:complete len:217 (-),score=28.73 TRINITY_DN3105_c0_g1_i1:23-673(-)
MPSELRFSSLVFCGSVSVSLVVAAMISFFVPYHIFMTEPLRLLNTNTEGTNLKIPISGNWENDLGVSWEANCYRWDWLPRLSEYRPQQILAWPKVSDSTFVLITSPTPFEEKGSFSFKTFDWSTHVNITNCGGTKNFCVQRFKNKKGGIVIPDNEYKLVLSLVNEEIDLKGSTVCGVEHFETKAIRVGWWIWGGTTSAILVGTLIASFVFQEKKTK